MPRSLDQIGAAIPFGALRRIWLKAPRLEIQAFPDAYEFADVERKKANWLGGVCVDTGSRVIMNAYRAPTSASVSLVK